MNERNTWMFIDLYDESGKIQLFCHKDNLSEQQLKHLRLCDKGDFLGAHGTIRRTKQGELSVKVTELRNIDQVICNHYRKAGRALLMLRRDIDIDMWT